MKNCVDRLQERTDKKLRSFKRIGKGKHPVGFGMQSLGSGIFRRKPHFEEQIAQLVLNWTGECPELVGAYFKRAEFKTQRLIVDIWIQIAHKSPFAVKAFIDRSGICDISDLRRILAIAAEKENVTIKSFISEISSKDANFMRQLELIQEELPVVSFDSNEVTVNTL